LIYCSVRHGFASHAATLGGCEIVHWLAARGYRVVLSGGNDAAELAYVADLISGLPPDAINATGKLSLGASASVAIQPPSLRQTRRQTTHAKNMVNPCPHRS
jgi:ADP-heptose:LPS heptosyltransferase